MPTAETKTKQLKEAEQTPLVPCPFCGSDGVLTNKAAFAQTGTGHGIDYHVSYFVVCSNMKCGCALRWTNNPVRAVKNWNRRLIRLVCRPTTPK